MLGLPEQGVDLRLQAHDIAAMAQLGHAKAAGQVQGVQALEQAVKVLLGAQLGNGAPAQGEVHPRLDGQAVVAQGQALQPCLELERVCNGQLSAF